MVGGTEMKKSIKRFIAAALCVTTTLMTVSLGTVQTTAATGVYTTVDVVSTTTSSKTISQLTAGDEYAVRDGIIALDDTSVNRMASEHFQIIWGSSNTSSTTVDDNFIKGNLINLENIRTFYIERLGMQDICYSMTSAVSGKYKTNIYVSNTGISSFEDDWAYMSADSDGFAYLFLNPDAMRVDPPSWVVPHELAHAFTYHQGGTVDYAWYEATANWFRDQYLGSEYYAYNGTTYGPDSDFFAPYIKFGDYYVPHMLNWYDTWPIFLYISENPDNIDGLGLEFMQNFFADTGSAANGAYSSMYDKIEKLSGVSIKTILGNMTKRLATMDFSRQQYYLDEFEITLNSTTEIDIDGDGANEQFQNRDLIYTTLGAADSQGYQSSGDDAPMQTGFNIIPLNVDLSKDRIDVDFVNTSSASGSDFRTSLVTNTSNNTTRYSNMISGSGKASITLNGDETAAYLVVCATPDTIKDYQVNWDSKSTDTDTRYTYKVKIEAVNGEAPTQTTTEATTETTTQSTITDDNNTAVMGTYVFGTGASDGDFNITSKSASTAGNISFGFRDMTADGAKTRKNDGNTNIQFTLGTATNVTLTSTGKGMVATAQTGEEYTFAAGTETVTLPAGTYTIQGASTSSNSALTKMVLAQAASGETTTETTTAATTTTTTKATTTTTTTETTTETTTSQGDQSDLTPLDAGTYSASAMLGDSTRFAVSGSSSTSQIKINESGYVEFNVNDGANVTVSFKCGSTNTSKSASITLNGKTSSTLMGGDAAQELAVTAMSGGTYRITASQSGGTTAQIISVTVSYGTVATTTTETTTETTTTTTTETTTETTTAATGTIPGDVDLDGDIDDADAALLLKYVMGSISLTDDRALINADCDGTAGIDVNDAVWILNHKTTTETTTETTTAAATTETATETTTQSTARYGLADGTYSAADLLSNPNVIVSGSTSETQIKIDENGYVDFGLYDTATVTVNFKCGSSNSSKSASLSLYDSTSQTINGGEAAQDFTVYNLESGYYRIYAAQTGGTTAQIVSITIKYETVETTTETTTEATTEQALGDFISPPITALSSSLYTQGNPNLVVFYVDFPDCQYSYDISQADLREMTFGDEDTSNANYPFESMSAFYSRSSKGAMKLQGEVFVYTTKENRSAYDTDKVKLAKECFEAFDNDVDFSQFDGNGDGKIDATLFTVPTAAGDDDWWPCSGGFGDSTYEVDGVNVGNIITGNAQPDNASDYKNYVSSYLHEMGHCMGLPDYYLYYSDDFEAFHGNAGTELMDADAYSDFCAFSKLMLGWYHQNQISVYDSASGTQSFTLYNAQTDNGNCLIIPNGTLDDRYFSEYFIVEYVTPEINNYGLTRDRSWDSTGDGVRIFHVNAAFKDDYWYPILMYQNGSEYTNNDDDGIRLIRLVGDANSEGVYTTGKVINNNTSGFGWYDSSENESVDPGVKITIGEKTNGAYTVTVSPK